MSDIKASVIIAAYNIENYIERCIESVLHQSESEIEIVVVNDGSTDKTGNIIENLSKKDNRIVVINQSNKGLIEARKSGLKIAKGEYILFLDGDDWLEEKTIEVLYHKAAESGSDIILYNAYLAYDDKKIEMKTYISEKSKEIKIDPIKCLFTDIIIPSIWSKFIKKDYISKNNIELPSKISYAEDLGTVLSLFTNYPRIDIVEKSLYNYYQRSDSLTQVGNKRVIDIIYIVEFIENKLMEKNIYVKYKSEFEYMAFKYLFLSGMQYIGLENKALHHKIYKKYENMNINILKNKYIQNKIKSLNIIDRLRIKAYSVGYKSGFYYDMSKNKVKSIYNKLIANK